MIVDLRTYSIRPGKLGDYMKLYGSEGFPIQQKHLGNPIGYFRTEIGDLNQAVHMWMYENAAEREQRRSAMEGDPEWTSYRNKSTEAGYIMNQQNKLLVPANFDWQGPDSLFSDKKD